MSRLLPVKKLLRPKGRALLGKPAPGTNKILLEDGTSKVLQEDGTSKVIKE